MSSDSVLPHIADGNGWKTLITLVNMDSEAVEYALTFHSSGSSALWSLDLAGVGKVNTVSGTIPIGGSVFFETTNPPGATATGWAQLENNYNNIGGMAVFRFSPGDLQDTEAVVPFASKYDDDFYIPFDNRNGFVTSIAAVNPSTYSAATVFVEFRDASGARILLDTITLQPLEHLAFSTVEKFPETDGKNGVIEFTTSAYGISALGIRFNPKFSFTSVHALSK
ncbi:MAG: hypothetical protein ABFD89_06475 [Bryobacteraceae bacterium]